MLDVSVPAIARVVREGSHYLPVSSRIRRRPILTGEDGIDGFEQREEQLVAVLHGLAGTDTDVKVVFRQQVLAAKVRCFFCVLIGGRIACVEVRCPHLLAVGRGMREVKD
jgi:hypothetical protein